MWFLLLSLALGQPLALDTVLQAVDARVPELAIGAAQVDAATADRLAARGAFDPEIVGSGTAYGGPEPWQISAAHLGGQTLLGPTWSVGVRHGVGAVPVYAQGDKTVEAGQLEATLAIPLLDGLGMSEDRSERIASSHRLAAAEADLHDLQVSVRAQAAAAYWSWVAAGQRLSIHRELLTLAEDRTEGLARQVEAGSQARIDLLDNQRVLFDRQGAAAKAEAELVKAAQTLSLYYRDDAGNPVVASEDQLPVEPVQSEALASPEDHVQRALQHPALQVLSSQRSAQQATLRGARNALLPDLWVAVTQEAPLDSSVGDTKGTVTLEVPLLARSERATVQAHAAKLLALDEKLRGERDKRTAKVLAAHVSVEASRVQEQAAQSALERAREVASMERRRLDLGGSELFTLLLREEKVAEAGLKQADAALRARLAETRLEALVAADWTSS